MKVTIGTTQYAPFGDKYVRRDVSDPDNPGDWQEVEADDLSYEERLEIEVAHRLRDERIAGGPRMRRVAIQRSEANEAIARELGFAGGEADVSLASRSDTPSPADTLAQRLTDTGALGTAARVSDARFDAIAHDLGLDPEEMRARFRGEIS